MPYIGKSPQQGNYSKLDDFSGDFDGSDATHAIASGGTAIDPITPNALIISINGVIQEPATDYTVSGSNITFTTAPAAGDNFFGVALGEGVSIGTPSNSSVTSAKLSGNLVTPGTLDVNGQELILDANGNTSITADTDDQIDIKIAGADDFQFTANTFTVLAGSTIANSVVDSITAGSTQTQAGATALTGMINRVTVSGTNGDGVKLPAAVAGLTCLIDNADAAQTIDVWPASGNKIEGGSDDAVDPTSIAAGTSRTYFCVDGDNWRRNIPPGTVLQRQIVTTSAVTSNATTTEVATGLTDTISLLDAGSAVRITAAGVFAAHRNAGSPTLLEGNARLWRTAVTSGTKIADVRFGWYIIGTFHNANRSHDGCSLFGEDSPGTKSSTTYVVGIDSGSTDVLIQFNGETTPQTMVLEEIAT